MLLSKDTAIIPIGLSCQPTAQLQRLRDTFSRLLSQNFIYQSSILNWTVCTTEGVAEFLERYSNEAITCKNIVIDQRLELVGAQVWIMHEIPANGYLYQFEDLPRVASKFEHMRKKFFALRCLRNRTFVLCQADNNLTVHYMWEDGRMDFAFDRPRLDRIKHALDKVFPYGRNRLVVLGLKGRIDQINWSYPTVVFEPDDSEWSGDDCQWDAAAPIIARGTNRLAFLPNDWPRPVLRVSALQSAFWFSAGDERVKTQVGRRIGPIIMLNGAGGAGIFGPYKRLALGIYEISIVFQTGDIRGAAVMEVGGGVKSEVFGKRSVVASNLVGREAKLRLVLSQDTINVEVRLWCNEGFIGAVEGIRIMRTSP